MITLADPIPFSNYSIDKAIVDGDLPFIDPRVNSIFPKFLSKSHYESFLPTNKERRAIVKQKDPTPPESEQAKWRKKQQKWLEEQQQGAQKITESVRMAAHALDAPKREAKEREEARDKIASEHLQEIKKSSKLAKWGMGLTLVAAVLVPFVLDDGNNGQANWIDLREGIQGWTVETWQDVSQWAESLRRDWTQ